MSPASLTFSISSYIGHKGCKLLRLCHEKRKLFMLHIRLNCELLMLPRIIYECKLQLGSKKIISLCGVSSTDSLAGRQCRDTSISNSQQQKLQLLCCPKCLQAVNGPSFPFQYCEFPCNSIVLGTFPLTTVAKY